ncbi:23S rRNA (uracil(1939)-C(5))-methyltransferase RlmD [Thiospirillum jenense]|uniref:23S rRNA (uracil(1939)-C(5))-methyltransferase RlmD n=1 Tax=Thiospirillum jenense TaxID=1653858 RepID=A0A839HK25_9GAMM|nr:23S rRNA (uracil(1939)-C(5))-methyltransferase RlmD [Thiospirillum jenense]MBB1127098.1 23S rRNA (uracil(1939)-C(5))-methyltransferase RlmD [Thiospirillum jenense]
MSTHSKTRLSAEPIEVVIESLSHDGRGVTHLDGKAIFVSGALPGERVQMRYRHRARHHDEAEVVALLTTAAERVTPTCPHFAQCGGCALQHLQPSAQIVFKQQILSDTLQRIGKVTPAHWLPPLVADHWGYRRKARLGVRYVAKKERVLVGFRERQSSFIADLQQCAVLHPSVGVHLAALGELIGQLDCREQVPQIELAQGDDVAVLVLRILKPLSAADVERLTAFAATTGVVFYQQDGGLETIRPLPGQAPVQLRYYLPESDVTIAFTPGDFTQVNLALNRLLVAQALQLLNPQPHERVLDLFCGVGNFTLPLARRAAMVVGVEGDAKLIARAKNNSEINHLPQAEFQCADLYRADRRDWTWSTMPFDKALLDPPRSGAWEVLDALAATGVRRVVYVSCYPATLARDAEHLVHQLGFQLTAAGALDMFPHTAHLESLAVFDRR